jgi:endonuclease G
MKNIRLSLYIFTAILVIASCKKSDPGPAPVDPVVTDTTSNPISSPAKETFESGSKDIYNDSTIILSTGKWSFSNAVIGTSAEDRKNGTKSARIQENGKLNMNFDVVGGVYRIAVSSGVYGSDGPGSWQLWKSTNSGYSYSQVGTGIITSGATLQSDTIIVSAVSKVRFSIRKTPGSGRINIDDIDFMLTSGPLAPNFTDDNHMLLGNPSNATGSVLDENNYYMGKPYYSLSYNKTLGRANWVSWHLSMADIGTTQRQDDFREDPSLPDSWYHVSNASYTGSGFDRGHECPSNDRTLTVEANSSTFLMTNIIPQAPNVNQGPWQKFEDSCNRLVTTLGKEVYIICGSYGVGGTGNNGALNDIDNGRISVPAFLWKIAVVLPNGSSDLSRINNATRVIAVIIPNNNAVGITTNWKGYRVSVHDIELATGYNLLSNVPDAVQQAIEYTVDNL